MKKTIKKTLLTLGFVATIAVAVVAYNKYRGNQHEKSDDQRLGEFALLMMDLVGADLSPMRRVILARTLVRVTGEIFSEYSHREAFVGMVAQESKFNANIKSPAGAVGLAQLMPQYAPSFAKLCGLSDFKATDLIDVELNLYLGACFYRDLLENKLINGNPVAAQTAYNSGQNGEALKSLLAQRAISNTETSNYSTMISYKKEEVRRIQENIEKTNPSLATDSPSTDLEVLDENLQLKNSQLAVRFKISNKTAKEPIAGTATVVATFKSPDGTLTYVTANNVLEQKEIQVKDLIEASKKSSQPFSIKRSKDHEIMISSPKNKEGQFTEVKIFVTDPKQDAFILKTLPI